MIRIYQLIYKKYYPLFIDLLKDLEAANAFPQTDIASLKRSLNAKNYYRSITIILKFLSILKERILSSKKHSPTRTFITKDTSRRAFPPCMAHTTRKNLKPSAFP